MTASEKTHVARPRKRRTRWVPVPLIPQGVTNDVIDRARAAEWFASGSPGTGAGK